MQCNITFFHLQTVGKMLLLFLHRTSDFQEQVGMLGYSECAPVPTSAPPPFWSKPFILTSATTVTSYLVFLLPTLPSQCLLHEATRVTFKNCSKIYIRVIILIVWTLQLGGIMHIHFIVQTSPPSTSGTSVQALCLRPSRSHLSTLLLSAMLPVAHSRGHVWESTGYTRALGTQGDHALTTLWKN